MVRCVAFLSALAALMPTTAAMALNPKSPEAALAGGVAGPPTDCIADYDRDRGGQLFADSSILYVGRGSTVYLNHPSDCPAFRSDDMIVSRTPGTQLCRGDILQVFQNTGGIFRGTCALGQFTPYSRAK